MIRRFNRYELKYVIPVSRSAAIIEDLLERIRPDKYGGLKGYGLTSLYYDSPDYDFFWAKIEGLKFRRKVRLRVYPGEDITQVKTGLVEIKQRTNTTVQKRRLVLPIEDAHQLCLGNFDIEAANLDQQDASVAHEVSYLARSMNLRPSAITAYQRQAFEGDNENIGLRVTFDTMVSARMHALDVTASASNRLILPEDWCIMEVKANETIPDWVISMLARHDCQLRKVSKYCAGIAQIMGFKVMPRAMGIGVPLAPPTDSPSGTAKDDATGSREQHNG